MMVHASHGTSSGSNQVDDEPCDLIRCVFLYEMTAAFDGGMGEPSGSGYSFPEQGIHPGGDGIVISKCAEKGFVES